jgi:ABC-type proline/glycine betaine transport system permease subunit
MSAQKTKYIDRIRKETAYPTFRAFIRIISLLFIGIGFVISCIGALGLGSALSGKLNYLELFMTIIPIVVGIILAAAGLILQEASIMIADIADSITDLNYRYEPGEQAGE